jgi:hypothetical protein
MDALEPASGATKWTRPVTDLGFPAADVPLPSGFTPSYADVLPSSAGVFFSFGNCIGN